MDLSIFLDDHKLCTPINCKANSQTKCKTVAVFGETPTFYVDDYPLYEVHGVVQVGVQPRDNYGWDVAYTCTPPESISQVYFCVDTIYNETWPHWVDESAIYLHLFHKIKEIYPSLKLFSLKKKLFKIPMYRTFDISEEDVVFTIDTNKNKFVFPHYISLADHRLPFLFMKHMSNFYKYITQKCPTKQKDIDILYLPRGTKENSKGTDRTIPVQPALIDFLSGMPNAKILYTDDTQNMIDQWDTVKRAKVIIVNEGGNHGINGFFAENSKIIVLGGHGCGAHFQNPSPALMYYDSINRGNKYYHIDYFYPLNIVISFICMVFNEEVAPVAVPKVSCWRNCSFCKYQEYSKKPLVHSI
jgi:hypothetical protein